MRVFCCLFFLFVIGFPSHYFVNFFTADIALSSMAVGFDLEKVRSMNLFRLKMNIMFAQTERFKEECRLYLDRNHDCHWSSWGYLQFSGAPN